MTTMKEYLNEGANLAVKPILDYLNQKNSKREYYAKGYVGWVGNDFEGAHLVKIKSRGKNLITHMIPRTIVRIERYFSGKPTFVTIKNENLLPHETFKKINDFSLFDKSMMSALEKSTTAEDIE